MANKNGHWYTDKNGNHYFVEEGQTPQEGWEASKRRKMINGGKYQVSEDGNEYRDVEKDEYDKFEADDASFDDNIDDDFGFDEVEDDQDTIMGLERDIKNASNSDEMYLATSAIDKAVEDGLITEETADRLYAKADEMIDEFSENDKYNREMKAAQEQNAAMSEGQDNPNNSEPKDKTMPAYHWEKDDSGQPNHIVIDEGPHKGERYDNEEDFHNSTKEPEDEHTKKHREFLEKGKATWNQKLQKGDKVVIEDKDGNDIEAYIDGFWYQGNTQDEDTYEEGKDNNWHDFRAVKLVDKDGKYLGSVNAFQIKKHERPQPQPSGTQSNQEKISKVKNLVDKGILSQEDWTRFMDGSLSDEELIKKILG